MLKAVIFDFDYTLGDSTSGIALSINYALEQLGYAAGNMDDIKSTIGLSLKETYFALTKKQDLEEAEQFAALFRKKADEVMLDNTELYTGVKDVLLKLREKEYKTAIVTTKFHYRIEQILSKYAANELIDIIVGAEDVKEEKPDPEGLLYAIAHLKVSTEDVLYVGDSFIDAKTAEKANVKFIATLTGTTTRENFENYNSVYIAEDILEVYQYIMTLRCDIVNERQRKC